MHDDGIRTWLRPDGPSGSGVRSVLPGVVTTEHPSGLQPNSVRNRNYRMLLPSTQPEREHIKVVVVGQWRCGPDDGLAFEVSTSANLALNHEVGPMLRHVVQLNRELSDLVVGTAAEHVAQAGNTHRQWEEPKLHGRLLQHEFRARSAPQHPKARKRERRIGNAPPDQPSLRVSRRADRRIESESRASITKTRQPRVRAPIKKKGVITLDWLVRHRRGDCVTVRCVPAGGPPPKSQNATSDRTTTSKFGVDWRTLP
jgi:hypothetical protein